MPEDEKTTRMWLRRPLNNMPWFNFEALAPGPQVLVLAAFMILASNLAMSNTSLADELPVYERVRALQPGRRISDAELIDQDGEAFRLNELRGRVALVFFGFTNCPDVCPLTMTKFRLLQDSGNVDLDKVVFVLISVDSERDTPATLKAFLEKFSERFIGLTGESATINAIAKEFSAAFYKGSPSGENGDYLVSHSRQAFVVDARGNLRAEFYDPSIEAMIAVTQALISEGNHSAMGSEN